MWHKVDVDVGREAQEAIDDGASEYLFPPTACRLAQDNLGDLVLFGKLHERPGHITTLCANDFGTQIFREHSMLFQAVLRFFPVSL